MCTEHRESSLPAPRQGRWPFKQPRQRLPSTTSDEVGSILRFEVIFSIRSHRGPLGLCLNSPGEEAWPLLGATWSAAGQPWLLDFKKSNEKRETFLHSLNL